MYRYSDEQVARVCHEANRELQRLQDDPAPSAPWDCEPEEIRQSAVDGVRNARRGCTPRESHENWLRFKDERGWAYGPEKDPERKTHPCMVSYEDLPAGQRDKDRLFLLIVTALTDVAQRLPAGKSCGLAAAGCFTARPCGYARSLTARCKGGRPAISRRRAVPPCPANRMRTVYRTSTDDNSSGARGVSSCPCLLCPGSRRQAGRIVAASPVAHREPCRVTPGRVGVT